VISRPSAKSDSATFLVLEKGYSRDACTDFDAKYVKRRGSVQGSAFWGSRNQNLRFGPPFSPKTAIFGPHFDENVAKSPKFCTQIGNQGQRIEQRCLNLQRKCIDNRVCAYAVQMLLTIAANATKCSPFEVQYGKSTSTRTTAVRHLGQL